MCQPFDGMYGREVNQKGLGSGFDKIKEFGAIRITITPPRTDVDRVISNVYLE